MSPKASNSVILSLHHKLSILWRLYTEMYHRDRFSCDLINVSGVVLLQCCCFFITLSAASIWWVYGGEYNHSMTQYCIIIIIIIISFRSCDIKATFSLLSDRLHFRCYPQQRKDKKTLQELCDQTCQLSDTCTETDTHKRTHTLSVLKTTTCL